MAGACQFHIEKLANGRTLEPGKFFERNEALSVFDKQPKPCFETLDTSTAEVRFPSLADFIFVFLDQMLYCRERTTAHVLLGAPICIAWLEEIPQVSVQVLEYSDHAIGFLLWWTHEHYAICRIALVVSPEIIGVKKQEHPTACLRTDTGLLIFC